MKISSIFDEYTKPFAFWHFRSGLRRDLKYEAIHVDCVVAVHIVVLPSYALHAINIFKISGACGKVRCGLFG